MITHPSASSAAGNHVWHLFRTQPLTSFRTPCLGARGFVLINKVFLCGFLLINLSNMSKSWASQMSARIAASCPLPQRTKQKKQLNTAHRQKEFTSGSTSAQKEKAGTSPVGNPTTQQGSQSTENLQKASASKETSSFEKTASGNRANTTL